MKDEILFVSTIHRMSERVIPVIKKLQENFNVKILNTGQSSFNTEYDASLRYKKYVESNFKNSSIFNTPKISYKGDGRSVKTIKDIAEAANSLINNKTACVILDDSRFQAFPSCLYSTSKDSGSVVFANSHGNMPTNNMPVYYGFKGRKFYDYIFVLGDCERDHIRDFGFDKNLAIPAGIPENDDLSLFERSNDYILVIPNFILQRELGGYKFDQCKASLFFSSEVIGKMKLLDLQQKLGKKIIFKLKHRMSSPINEETDVLRERIPKGLDYEIIHHVDCEQSLIAGASCVLSYGSTMSFKPIQMRIPTVVYRELGNVGNFIEYKGLISIDDSYKFIFDKNFMEKEGNRFLTKTLKGGCDFTSSDIYLKSIYRRIGREDLVE